jgi:hypothetical protein
MKHGQEKPSEAHDGLVINKNSFMVWRDQTAIINNAAMKGRSRRNKHKPIFLGVIKFRPQKPVSSFTCL